MAKPKEVSPAAPAPAPVPLASLLLAALLVAAVAALGGSAAAAAAAPGWALDVAHAAHHALGSRRAGAGLVTTVAACLAGTIAGAAARLTAPPLRKVGVGVALAVAAHGFAFALPPRLFAAVGDIPLGAAAGLGEAAGKARALAGVAADARLGGRAAARAVAAAALRGAASAGVRSPAKFVSNELPRYAALATLVAAAAGTVTAAELCFVGCALAPASARPEACALRPSDAAERLAAEVVAAYLFVMYAGARWRLPGRARRKEKAA